FAGPSITIPGTMGSFGATDWPSLGPPINLMGAFSTLSPMERTPERRNAQAVTDQTLFPSTFVIGRVGDSVGLTWLRRRRKRLPLHNGSLVPSFTAPRPDNLVLTRPVCFFTWFRHVGSLRSSRRNWHLIVSGSYE